MSAFFDTMATLADVETAHRDRRPQRKGTQVYRDWLDEGRGIEGTIRTAAQHHGCTITDCKSCASVARTINTWRQAHA